MNLRLIPMLAAALLLAGCANQPAARAAGTPDLSRFHTVLVESVRIAPEAGMLSGANRQALERELRRALVGSIPADLRALAPAGDVLRVQVTVTALDSVYMSGAAANARRVAVADDRGAIEFEVRYYQHGASMPFATIVERRKARPFTFGDGFTHYGHAVGALRAWGTGLASSLPDT